MVVGAWTTENADVTFLDDIRIEGMMVVGVDVCTAAVVVAAEGSSSSVGGREDQRHRLGALLTGKFEYRCFV